MILKIGLIVLLVVLILLVALLLVVLFVPFILQINTDDSTYRLEWKGIVSCWISGPLENLRLNLKAPFYRKSIDPFTPRKQIEEPKTKPTTDTKGKKSEKSWMTRHKLAGMLKSFRVRTCAVNIDTGDYVQNALLVPVFQLINRTGATFTINFQGDSSIEFYASNTVWRLGRAYIMN
jgi:hypothetical protein